MNHRRNIKTKLFRHKKLFNSFSRKEQFNPICRQMNSGMIFKNHIINHILNKQTKNCVYSTMESTIKKLTRYCVDSIDSLYKSYTLSDIDWEDIERKPYIKKFRGIVMDLSGRYRFKCPFCDRLFRIDNNVFLIGVKSKISNPFENNQYDLVLDKMKDLIANYLPKQPFL